MIFFSTQKFCQFCQEPISDKTGWCEFWDRGEKIEICHDCHKKRKEARQ